ncbi:extracellular calcium-sensing receptor-like [Megalops cyprinoides]|uniref:extracellular calcium-sensing receptor-like n=1 Tax=Megalops cyprinoides TaxID=118141 RepID=UPI001864E87D|nr:extracellular calcium-sensing receptor-like [Megalops cyprinoides]
MVFAIEEINNSTSLLPGVRLGYRILDSCDHIHTGLRGALSLVNDSSGQAGAAPLCLTGAPVSAVIGLASSSPTRAVAHTLGPFGIPLVSYFATCACLNDKHAFPSFLRTVPSDLFQVRGLVRLVTHFGWRWVGAVGTEDDYSRYGIQAFSEQLRERGGCLAFYSTLPKVPSPERLRQIADTLEASRARVVIAFSTEGQLYDLLAEVARRNLTGWQWVASEAWVTATLLSAPRFHSVLTGTLGFAFRSASIPGLGDFLLQIRPSPRPESVFVNMFWEEMFSCRLGFHGELPAGPGPVPPVCTGAEELRGRNSIYTDVSQLRVSYNVYKAVYAIAHALHQLLQCDHNGQATGNRACKTGTQFEARELLSYLRRVNFTNQLGEKVYFDTNGEPVPLYDIINWQNDDNGGIRFKKVGSYDASAPEGLQLQMEEDLIMWTGGQTQAPVSVCTESCPPGTRQATRPGEPVCCFDCLPCADGEISNSTGSTECTKCPLYYWSDKQRVTCVASVEEFLSFHDSMGIVLVTLSLLGVVLTLVITVIFYRFRATPIVSYFASCNCLSDRKEFPTFMRTMPSDVFQVKAIAKLVSHFGWTWLGVIGGDSDYARFAVQLFLEESAVFGVCAAYVHYYPLHLSKESVFKLAQVIKRSSAKVILCFSGEPELHYILQECKRQNITDMQWIASEAWSTGNSLWGDFRDLLIGTLGFGIRRAEIPGLKNFLTRFRPSHALRSPVLSEFWEETFDCRLNGSLNTHVHGNSNTTLRRKPCTGLESLEQVHSVYADVSQLRVSYNVYKAVYLIAHALHNMSTCITGKGPFLNGSCADPKRVVPWQLFQYMKQVRFNILGEEISFNENGDPIASYDLLNWHEGDDGSLQLVKVGYYDASKGGEKDLIINESAIWFHRGPQAPQSMCSEHCPPGSRKATRKGQPICCYDCIPCAEGEISNETDSVDCKKCTVETWPNQDRDLCIPKAMEFLSYHDLMGVILCAVSVVGACATVAVSGVLFVHRNTPVVRGNNMELSFLLLLFLGICFLIGMAFIGEPTDWFCRIRYTAFGISFALCISCILAKTLVVLMAFRATLPGNNVMRWFGPAQQRASVFLCTSVQVVICLVWLTTKPPYAAHNTRYQTAKIIVECAVGSEVGFWCVLGYIGFLACLCFMMAFLARKLPDNFNEAKFITFSMLIFFAVWITFIPVYVSTSGKYTVAVHIFAILASAFGLLLCIFAPKCYIVLLKPEKNTRKQMMLKK